MRPVAVANRHPRLRFEPTAVARAVQVLDAAHDQLATRGSVLKNEGELSIVFLNDRALAEIHAQFLDDPAVTDVITFEGTPALGTAGEICVSADAAVRHLAAEVVERPLRRGKTNAVRRQRLDRRAFSREVTLYVVHGWLHLAGYDDLVPRKKRIMRRAEQRAMAVLERAGALPEFRLQR